MINYYKMNLSFNVNDINTSAINFSDTQWSTKPNVKQYNPSDILNTSLLNFFQNYKILKVFLFYLPPNTMGSIHIDGNLIKARAFAINIPWSSSDHLMKWYNHSTSEYSILNHTQANSPYLSFSETQVELVETATNVNQIMLVRTDVPHQMVNLDTVNPRWCVSIRIPEIPSWEDALLEFNDYLIK